MVDAVSSFSTTKPVVYQPQPFWLEPIPGVDTLIRDAYKFSIKFKNFLENPSLSTEQSPKKTTPLGLDVQALTDSTGEAAVFIIKDENIAWRASIDKEGKLSFCTNIIENEALGAEYQRSIVESYDKKGHQVTKEVFKNGKLSYSENCTKCHQ